MPAAVEQSYHWLLNNCVNGRWTVVSAVFLSLSYFGEILTSFLVKYFDYYLTVASTIVQQSLARLFNSCCWCDCSTVTGTIVQQFAGAVIQQSLVQLFNSLWHSFSTVTGMVLQQSLARFFNSYQHDTSTVTGSIFYMLAEFFNSDIHCWRIVPCTRNTTQDLVKYINTELSHI